MRPFTGYGRADNYLYYGKRGNVEGRGGESFEPDLDPILFEAAPEIVAREQAGGPMTPP